MRGAGEAGSACRTSKAVRELPDRGTSTAPSAAALVGSDAGADDRRACAAASLLMAVLMGGSLGAEASKGDAVSGRESLSGGRDTLRGLCLTSAPAAA